MREAGVAAVLAAVIGICLVTNRLGDRQTLVPAPEAVAEGFVKELMAGRYDRARPLMSAGATADYSRDRLASWINDLERETGSITLANGERSMISGESATAVVQVSGAARTVNVRLELAREQGLWRVARLQTPAD